MNYILSWWNKKEDKKPIRDKGPMLGDVVCLKDLDGEKWLYVLGKSEQENRILVSRAENKFEDIFTKTLNIDLDDNIFLFIGSPEKSPLKLNSKILKHSKIVKKNWYNEINIDDKMSEGWYLDGPVD